MSDKKKKKQEYLYNQIINKGFDSADFVQFMQDEREGGMRLLLRRGHRQLEFLITSRHGRRVQEEEGQRHQTSKEEQQRRRRQTCQSYDQEESSTAEKAGCSICRSKGRKTKIDGSLIICRFAMKRLTAKS